MKRLMALLLTLMVSSVGNTSIISLGLIPALSVDFSYLMSRNCRNFSGYHENEVGEKFACVGAWILGRGDSEILQALQSAGTLQSIDGTVLSGNHGNINIEVPDSILQKYGSEAVKNALEAYMSEVAPVSASME